MLRLSGEPARVEWQDTASQNFSGFLRQQQEQRSHHEDRPDPQWEGSGGQQRLTPWGVNKKNEQCDFAADAPQQYAVVPPSQLSHGETL